MNTYYELSDGGHRIDNMSFGPGHRYHTTMLSEVDNGEAEIVPYVAPAKSAQQIRDDALEALEYDFGDGRVIQCRPKDEANFKRAYKIFALTGVPAINWVMKDNVKHPVTEAELRTAEDAGVLAGAAIWEAYAP